MSERYFTTLLGDSKKDVLLCEFMMRKRLNAWIDFKKKFAHRYLAQNLGPVR